MRSRKQALRKNPLHPSAMTLNDVQVGVEFTSFNIYQGVRYRGRFVSKAFVRKLYHGGAMGAIVEIDGIRQAIFLGDYGITPYGTQHNDVNFTVRRSKEHLLPPVQPEPADLVRSRQENLLHYCNTK